MKRRSLQRQLVDELGRRIVTGEVAPGTVLPTEADLAEENGVSRTVSREALKSLAARGLVAARPRAGTRVLPPEEWSCFDEDVMRWRLTGPRGLAHLADLLELRLLVEPAAARRVAERSEAQCRRAIWRCFESLEIARDDPEAWIEATARMHSLILGGCANDLISGLGKTLQSAILHSRHLTRPVLQEVPRDRVEAPHENAIDEALARYRAIASAVRDGNGDRAEREMRRLLERVGDVYEYLDSSSAEGDRG